jgi:hypothetical protein
MSWWIIPVICADIIAGIGIGLLISYFVLKKQGKRFPFFQKKEEKAELTEPTMAFGIEPEEENPVESQDISTAPSGEIPEKEIPESAESKTVEPPADWDDKALVAELKYNLEIASRPAGEKLLKFQTEVWNVSQAGLDSTKPPFLNELSETYVDILLANNLVWLVADLGRDSPYFRTGYAEIKNRIVSRIKQVLPKVKKPVT